MKTCAKCKNYKDCSLFYKDKNLKDGLNRWCKQCLNDQFAARKAEKAQYDSKRYQETAEIRKAKNSLWKKENKAKILEYNRAYIGIRNKRVRQATPKNLSRDMKKQIIEIYRNRPSGYHVDHIIPLNGKNICGLHVPANLQYLPALENLKKGNR